MKIVIKNAQQWKLDFNKQTTATLKASEKTEQEAAQMLYENIVKRTPVGNPSLWHPPVWPKGYHPGSLKAAWKIEHNGDEVIIYNNLPYAERVENGWSKQAPAGMMKISLLEWNTLLEKAARQNKT